MGGGCCRCRAGGNWLWLATATEAERDKGEPGRSKLPGARRPAGDGAEPTGRCEENSELLERTGRVLGFPEGKESVALDV
jgi:hypothetical protein